MPYYNEVDGILKLPVPQPEVEDMVCSDGALLMLMKDGNLIQYGSGYQMAKIPFDHPVIQISSSANRFVALDTQGISIWEDNNLDGIERVGATCQTDVQIGDDYCLTIDSRGRMLGFGANTKGELGTGDNIPRNELTQVSFFVSDAPCQKLFAGHNFVLGLF